MSRANAPARAKLESIWRRLPDTMSSHEFDPTQDESLRLIIDASGSLWKHNYADASAWRTMLVSGGALLTETVAGATTYYKAAAFPAPPNPEDWVANENAKIRQTVATAEAMKAHERKAARAAQDVLNAPIIEREQRAFLKMLDEAGLSPEKIAALVRAEAEVAAARAVAVYIEAADTPQPNRRAWLARR